VTIGHMKSAIGESVNLVIDRFLKSL